MIEADINQGELPPNYTEKEVNTILRRFHLDVVGLRRGLIDSGLMARESNGSRYWRLQRSDTEWNMNWS